MSTKIQRASVRSLKDSNTLIWNRTGQIGQFIISNGMAVSKIKG